MKRLLLLVIPVLALLILAAPVAAEEKHGNSPDTQAASEVEHGKSADAQSRNDERKADFEDEEANSEEDDSAEKNGNGAQRLQFFEVPGGNWETVSDIEVEGRVNLVAPIEGGIWTRTKGPYRPAHANIARSSSKTAGRNPSCSSRPIPLRSKASSRCTAG